MNKNIQHANHPRFWETHKEIWIQEYDKLDYEHRQLCMIEPNGWFAEKASLYRTQRRLFDGLVYVSADAVPKFRAYLEQSAEAAE